MATTVSSLLLKTSFADARLPSATCAPSCVAAMVVRKPVHLFLDELPGRRRTWPVSYLRWHHQKVLTTKSMDRRGHLAHEHDSGCTNGQREVLRPLNMSASNGKWINGLQFSSLFWCRHKQVPYWHNPLAYVECFGQFTCDREQFPED
ncbi:hypothetical protein ACQ4PT_007834 [Festuca glaucescens]